MVTTRAKVDQASDPKLGSRSGGTGRRAGLKIQFSQESVGSTPTSGTMVLCEYATSYSRQDPGCHPRISMSMKICHVITRMIVGGAQENTLFTLRGHLEHGHTAKLVTGRTVGPEGNLLEKVTVPNLTVIHNPHLRREIHPVHDVLAILSLTKTFRQENFDIVHTHSSKAGVIARFAARKAGVPVIVHTVHGPSFHANQSWWLNFAFIVAERFASRNCDRNYAVANAMANTYMKHKIGTPDQYKTIYSGMELEPYLTCQRDSMLAKSLGIRSDAPVVGKIARLFELKGYDILVNAASLVVKEIPNAQFLIVGDGNLRRWLTNQIRNLGLTKHFIFAGLVDPAYIHKYIALMDIVVHLSQREGLPRSVVQALASEKPAIAFRLDGTPEVVKNHKTGILCTPRNTDEVAAAIIELLKNPDQAKAMGKNGRQLVKERWDWRFMVNALEADYKCLLKSKGIVSRNE